jgi:hypothetical protein
MIMAAAMAKFLWDEDIKVLRGIKRDSSNEAHRCGRSSLSSEPSIPATTKETPLTTAKKIGRIQSSFNLSGNNNMRETSKAKVMTHPLTEKRQLSKKGGMV